MTVANVRCKWVGGKLVFYDKTTGTVLRPDSQQYNNPLSQARRQMVEPPTFKKYKNNPVFKRNDAPWLKNAGYKMYWPWVVPNMRSILGSAALDDIYLYYSSDHASGNGGIGLATAPRPEGPYTDRGMIYVDLSFGNQTETPCVVWNPDTNLFHLYYQQSGVGRTQETCLATSPNGFNNWTLVKQGCIHVEDVDFPGDGHTGYAKVFRLGKTWVAQHLMGGGNYGRFGISYSKDGITWQTDPRPMSNFADWTEASDYRKIESVSTPFKFRGELWTTYSTSLLESGGVNTDRNIYVGPLKDLRKPAALYPTVPVGSAGAWDVGTVASPHVIEWDGALYMFYQGVGLDGNAAFGLAIAEV
ncbi:hypothetical protein KZ483_24155 [Paenibacillus sp. sptzw28]|uniref:hypothetical protein n=1 Tax=Paenibacillus sp. sptzw28 TaxID=715179 RepID=UPI001C6F4A87|nr:hypothetical protein [Paenibacillus sp. sptzw28]QYR20815.1 hypothetical protein KZ483_24155 [Paenibacillus sp. sptzw28]